MRKTGWLTVMIVMVLTMSCAVSAEETLYPFRENGQWGYMNRLGETVIPPQWADAAPFSGGVAAVRDAQGGMRLIEPSGRAVGDDIYDSWWKETPFCYLLLQYSDDGREQWGWYDKRSGHLEPCRYIVLQDGVTDSGLILAQWEDASGAGETAFLRRDTGEPALPVLPDGEIYSEEGFSEGYAYLCIESEDGWHQFMIDETGRKVTLPDGMWPAGAVHDGVMVIEEAGINCGIARPDGTVVRMPDSVYIDPFSEGRAFFCPADQAYDILGILDTEGRVVAEPQWTLDAGWSGADHVGFRHGCAVLLTLTDEKTHRGAYVILDREGCEVYRADAHPDGATTLRLPDSVMENGLVWYRLSSGEEDRFGLLRIRNGRTEDLTGPIFEAIHGVSADGEGFCGIPLHFSEGLYPVQLDGRWGYINELGETVIAPAWDAAEHFQNGLALVSKQDRLYYIDVKGNVVWAEK